MSKERNELRDDLERLEEELLDTQADLEESELEVARLRNQLRALVVGDANTGDAQQVNDLSCEAGSLSEALALARDRLSKVVIPAGVERDVDDIDNHVNSRSWGDAVWRGLRALHCYAEADFDGNFKQWCEVSGHAWGWSASDKKLALRESETVENNRRFTEQRRFPVDEAVDPSGSVVMWSHLKIAQGGGPLAPRVYFYDDTRGPTGKIHIGFVGPHKYTENTRTN